MNRFMKLSCNLLAAGTLLALATPALAGVEPTPTATATATAEPTPTATATATAEPTPTATATATATAEPTPTATATATAEPTPTATATAEPTPTATATATAEPTPTATATATAEPTPTATATAEPTPTATATATAEPTPTATATAEPTPTATATPGPQDCLCVPVKVVPQGNAVALKNVADGGKGSTLERSITVKLEAREASPGSCPYGATSDPTNVNLFIEDDDGDVVIDRDKGSYVCKSGTTVNAKFGVRYSGPENCKDSAVPTNQTSRGTLFVLASTQDASYEDTLKIQCKR